MDAVKSGTKDKKMVKLSQKQKHLLPAFCIMASRGHLHWSHQED